MARYFAASMAFRTGAGTAVICSLLAGSACIPRSPELQFYTGNHRSRGTTVVALPRRQKRRMGECILQQIHDARSRRPWQEMKKYKEKKAKPPSILLGRGGRQSREQALSAACASCLPITPPCRSCQYYHRIYHRLERRGDNRETGADAVAGCSIAPSIANTGPRAEVITFARQSYVPLSVQPAAARPKVSGAAALTCRLSQMSRWWKQRLITTLETLIYGLSSTITCPMLTGCQISEKSTAADRHIAKFPEMSRAGSLKRIRAGEG